MGIAIGIEPRAVNCETICIILDIEIHRCGTSSVQTNISPGYVCNPYSFIIALDIHTREICVTVTHNTNKGGSCPPLML